MYNEDLLAQLVRLKSKTSDSLLNIKESKPYETVLVDPKKSSRLTTNRENIKSNRFRPVI